MLLNVSTHQKVREWSTAILVDLFTYPNPYLSLGNYRNFYHSLYIAPFSNAPDSKSEFWRYFFSLTFHSSVSIKQILGKFPCMTWLFPCPSEKRLEKKRKNTLIRLTGMSEIYRTEKSIFFFSHNKFRNFDLLVSFHWSLRNFVISEA